MKTNEFRKFMDDIYTRYLGWLKSHLKRKKKVMDLKSEMQRGSHSLFWVWEFSKKAVLICFVFYIIVHFYAMVVMVKFQDFTYLGDLIRETCQIVRDCVFAYFIKAGLENAITKWRSHKEQDDETAG
jgi:hypothetical protein